MEGGTLAWQPKCNCIFSQDCVPRTQQLYTATNIELTTFFDGYSWRPFGTYFLVTLPCESYLENYLESQWHLISSAGFSARDAGGFFLVWCHSQTRVLDETERDWCRLGTLCGERSS